MPVKGVKKHSRTLQGAATQAPEAVGRALYEAGQLIELDAERSITQGSVSGPGHIPSRPGEPPNADTRTLDLNIETEIGGPGLVTVTSYAPYSAYLEYGTTRMASRPFMRPALNRNRKRLVAIVGEAIRTVIRRA